MSYNSSFTSQQVEQRLLQGYYDDIVEAGVQGGVLEEGEITKQELDLELAKRIKSTINGIEIPTIQYGEYKEDRPTISINSISNNKTAIEQVQDFFVSKYDKTIQIMNSINTDIAKVVGTIDGHIETNTNGDAIEFIITKTKMNSSQTTNGTVLKIQCDSDAHYNSKFTMEPTNESLILCSFMYDETGDNPTTPNSYIIRNTETPPLYTEKITVSNYGSGSPGKITYMDSVAFLLKDKMTEISKFMDERCTNSIYLRCWTYHPNSKGLFEDLKIERIQNGASNNGLYYSFIINSNSDYSYNESAGLDGIHEQISMNLYLGYGYEKYSANSVSATIRRIEQTSRDAFKYECNLVTTVDDGETQAGIDSSNPYMKIGNETIYFKTLNESGNTNTTMSYKIGDEIYIGSNGVRYCDAYKLLIDDQTEIEVSMSDTQQNVEKGPYLIENIIGKIEFQYTNNLICP